MRNNQTKFIPRLGTILVTLLATVPSGAQANTHTWTGAASNGYWSSSAD